MKELHYSRYYEFGYYITNLKPTHEQKLEYERFVGIEYYFNEIFKFT